jgi:hypothetical protein
VLPTNNEEIKKDTEFQAILKRFHDEFVGNECAEQINYNDCFQEVFGTAVFRI